MQAESNRVNDLVPAPFTPMDERGEVDYSIIPAYHSLLKANGISGVFICGSTGEGDSLTMNEKVKPIESWQECASGDGSFKVFALVGGDTLRDACQLAVFAEQRGVDAISFTAPSYFRPNSVEVLADCCEIVAANAPSTPFYCYHIPSLNGVYLPMIELLKRIDGRIVNFRGIKYTHEDFMD